MADQLTQIVERISMLFGEGSYTDGLQSKIDELLTKLGELISLLWRKHGDTVAFQSNNDKLISKLGKLKYVLEREICPKEDELQVAVAELLTLPCFSNDDDFQKKHKPEDFEAHAMGNKSSDEMKNFVNKGEVSYNGNKLPLFKRYWIVTSELFEELLRELNVASSKLVYVIFHPPYCDYPLYIPAVVGSYLWRKKLSDGDKVCPDIHPDDIRNPLYIPTVAGSYLWRK